MSDRELTNAVTANNDDVVIDIRDHIVAAGRGGLVDPELVIDLRDPHSTELAATAVGRASGRPSDLLPGHRLITITGGDRWMEAEAFVYDVYVTIGYTEPNSRSQVEELARWADRSRFHAVVDENDKIVGTVRTIFGNYAQLPVGQFDRTDHVDGDPVCELSSLVVDPRERSTGVIEHLYRAGWLDAWRSRSSAVVALIDDWLLDTFQETYHLPFRMIGEGKHYMGTDPVPVSLPCNGAAYVPMASSNPLFWAWTLEALDIAEILDWDLPVTLVDDADLDRYPTSLSGSGGTGTSKSG